MRSSCTQAPVPPDRAARTARRTPRAGVVVGTVAYMSPEQASGLPLDARSDIFSFGIVLYELLAGRRPFEAANDLELLKTIVHAAPPPLPSDVPELLRNAVERALEKDPADRYQSMRELVIELKRIGRKSDAARRSRRSPSARRHVDRACSGRSRWLAAGARRRRSRHGVLTGACPSRRRSAARRHWRATMRSRGSRRAATRFLRRSHRTGNTSSTCSREAPGRACGFGNSRARATCESSSRSRVSAFLPRSCARIAISWISFGFSASPGTLAAPELWRVPFLGGTPRRLAENVWGPIGWSPDGRQMAFVRVDAAAEFHRLSSLRTPTASASACWPRTQTASRCPCPCSCSATPLARPGVVARRPDAGPVRGEARRHERPQVLFIDVATGAEIAALDSAGGFVPQGLAWLDAESLLFNQPAEVGAPVQLWRMSYPGGAVSRLTNDLSSYVGVSLDADRTSLVTAQSETRGALWVGTRRVRPVPRSCLRRLPYDRSVAWAGDRLLYDSLTNGRAGDCERARRGRGFLGGRLERHGQPSPTSDGQSIVYAKPGGHADAGIWVADADGRQARQARFRGSCLTRSSRPTIGRSSFCRCATLFNRRGSCRSTAESRRRSSMPSRGRLASTLSPDGRRLVFFSSDPQSRFLLVVCDLPSCANRHDLVAARELPPRARSVDTRRPRGSRISMSSGDEHLVVSARRR